MGNVIDFWEWRRARLGAVQPRTYLRRARRGQAQGNKHLTAGSDLSAELRKLLTLE